MQESRQLSAESMNMSEIGVDDMLDKIYIWGDYEFGGHKLQLEQNSMTLTFDLELDDVRDGLDMEKFV